MFKTLNNIFFILSIIISISNVVAFNSTNSSGITLEVWDSSDFSTIFINQTKIYANYTNTTDPILITNCDLYQNHIGIWKYHDKLKYNATSQLYELIANNGYLNGYGDSLPVGYYQINITCNNLSTSEYVNISKYPTNIDLEITGSLNSSEVIYFAVNFTSSKTDLSPIYYYKDISTIGFSDIATIDLNSKGIKNDFAVVEFDNNPAKKIYISNYSNLAFHLLNITQNYGRTLVCVDYDNDNFFDELFSASNTVSNIYDNKLNSLLISQNGEFGSLSAKGTNNNNTIFFSANYDSISSFYSNGTIIWNKTLDLSNINEIETLDLDNDGYSDEVVSIQSCENCNTSIKLFNSSGDIIFSKDNGIGSYNGDTFAIDAGDVDNDYKDDLGFVIRDNSNFLVYNSSFDVIRNKSFGIAPYELFFFDSDNDGFNDDLVVGHYNGISVYNDSDVLVWTNNIGRTYSVLIFDFNNDGLDDIIASNNVGELYIFNSSNGNILYYFDIGTQVSKDSPHSSRQKSPGLDFGDVNKDGSYDLYVANNAGDVYIFQSVACEIILSNNDSYYFLWNYSSKLWLLNYTFSTGGNYSYNISCQQNGYEIGTYQGLLNITPNPNAPNLELIYPNNNTIFSGLELSFGFNVTDDKDVLSCNLFINNGTSTNAMKSNNSVINNTNTYFLLNNSFVNGDYSWWINCSDGDNEVKSQVRNISITVMNLTIWDEFVGSEVPIEYNESVWFFAEYGEGSNHTSYANCNITFSDGISGIMNEQNNSMAGYNFSRLMYVASGVYNYSINCTLSGNYQEVSNGNIVVDTVLENLTEMFRRKGRYESANLSVELLEDTYNDYTWQPESIMYYDEDTGNEVWVLVHLGDNEDIYSKEHGSNGWNYDGSTIGFIDYTRGRNTTNPDSQIISDRRLRWLVNTDGSNMKSSEGYGKFSFGFAGLGWAKTENAYYAFGGGTGTYNDGDPLSIYKVNLAKNNSIISTEMIINTSLVDDLSKTFVKDGIGALDKNLVLFTSDANLAQNWSSPNPINSTRSYFIKYNGTDWVFDSYWGIARHIGPSTDNWLNPYADHEESYEVKFHDVWSPGLNGDYLIGDYNEGSLFVWFKSKGSASDGGPLWEDWDGDSFGVNEEIKVIADGAAGENMPPNPYGIPYFGHPTFDRWGKYGLIGTYTDIPEPGTKIYDIDNNIFLSSYVMNYNHYDGQHHSWSGWTDSVIGIHPQDGSNDSYKIMMNQWYDNYTQESFIAHTHHPGLDYYSNYNGYPRPSQSPDGTKILFSATWLSNEYDSNSYISYAVAYYPNPPTNISANYNSGINLTWLPPTYTIRGWPNESIDNPPFAREIQRYNIWRSTNQNSNWQIIASVNSSLYQDDYYGVQVNLSELKYIDNPGDGTWYYAITSVEHSKLESRNLSEILQVNTSGASIIGTSIVQSQGQSSFWTNKPASVTNFNYTVISDYDTYNLTWNEPNDSKIRFYNIYYSTDNNPNSTNHFRIASLPVGTNKYIDWLANPNKVGYYGITSVDYQGNEGDIIYLTNNSIENISSDNPPVSISNKPNNANITTNTTIIFNCSATDDKDLDNITLYGNWSSGWHANETVIVNGINASIELIKILVPGNYSWMCQSCDNSSQCTNSTTRTLIIQALDTQSPLYSNNQTLSPSIYSPSTPTILNITWTDNQVLDTISIETNISGIPQNYSSSVINQILSAGNYYWKSYANDTQNNQNQTPIYYFTINKAIPIINLQLNGTQNDITIERTNIINITTNAINLYESSTPISQGLRQYNNVGTYTITANTTGTQNYTSNSITYNITVQDATNPIITNLQNISITNSSAIIQITANENINITLNFNQTIYQNSTPQTNHQFNLISLTANTTYIYNLTICDEYDNCINTLNYNLTTLFIFTNTPPQINLINTPNNIINNTLTIPFTFNTTDSEQTDLTCILYINNIQNQTINTTINTIITFQPTLKDQQTYNYSISCFDGYNWNTTSTYNFTINYTPILVFNNSLFDMNITTNFSQYITNKTKLKNLSNVIFKNSYGMINYTNNLNILTSLNLTNNLIIINKEIQVNSQVIKGFNASAILTFYNITFVNPRVLKNSIVYNTNYSYNTTTNILEFNVTSFSIYTIEETPIPTCSDNIQNQGESGIDCGGPCSACPTSSPPSKKKSSSPSSTYISPVVTCESNYSCSSWGKCVLGFRTRTCSDLNNCSELKTETKECAIENLNKSNMNFNASLIILNQLDENIYSADLSTVFDYIYFNEEINESIVILDNISNKEYIATFETIDSLGRKLYSIAESTNIVDEMIEEVNTPVNNNYGKFILWVLIILLSFGSIGGISYFMKKHHGTHFNSSTIVKSHFNDVKLDLQRQNIKNYLEMYKDKYDIEVLKNQLIQSGYNIQIIEEISSNLNKNIKL